MVTGYKGGAALLTYRDASAGAKGEGVVQCGRDGIAAPHRREALYKMSQVATTKDKQQRVMLLSPSLLWRDVSVPPPTFESW